MSNNQDIHYEIERLIERYGNDVLRISYMYLKDYQRAEDAFQEVFLKAFRKYHYFKGQSSEKTWLLSITFNVCKDILRTSWIRRVIPGHKDEYHSAVTDIEESIVKKDEDSQLFQQVLSLPSPYKEVVILYYYQEFDTGAIANILGIAEGTVRSRLYRAREKIKAEMDRSENNG